MGTEIIALSDGQKTRLRAGLAKLKILEEHFVKLTKDKEGVSEKIPQNVCDLREYRRGSSCSGLFNEYEGLGEDDVIQIDSDKKGQFPIESGKF